MKLVGCFITLMDASHYIVNISGGGIKSIFKGLDDAYAIAIHGSGYQLEEVHCVRRFA